MNDRGVHDRGDPHHLRQVVEAPYSGITRRPVLGELRVSHASLPEQCGLGRGPGEREDGPHIKLLEQLECHLMHLHGLPGARAVLEVARPVDEQAVHIPPLAVLAHHVPKHRIHVVLHGAIVAQIPKVGEAVLRLRRVGHNVHLGAEGGAVHGDLPSAVVVPQEVVAVPPEVLGELQDLRVEEGGHLALVVPENGGAIRPQRVLEALARRGHDLGPVGPIRPKHHLGPRHKDCAVPPHRLEPGRVLVLEAGGISPKPRRREDGLRRRERRFRRSLWALRRCRGDQHSNCASAKRHLETA
mmetsp:Transcript_8353/g.21307  ORF Transcript_8353/g.21307 Transcript_8353/m.21307 type:complete len:299 (+) Transcript_8353:1054-1950(+)